MPAKRKERKILASNFVATIAAIVDNPDLPDAEFRQFIRSTLPIVIYDGCNKQPRN